jgi:hypothetical protein
MEERVPKKTSRVRRVKKNLGHAMALAWAASPRLLIRFSLLGMFNAIMPPISVYLGAVLVNKIAESRLHPLTLTMYFLLSLVYGSLS